MKIDKKIVRYLVLTALGLLFLYLLLNGSERVRGAVAFVKELLFPFVLGAALAFILNVPVRGYERLLKGIKKDSRRRVFAVLLTLLTFLLILAIIFVLLIPQVSKAVSSLPTLSTILEKSETLIKSFKPEWKGWGDLSDVENVEWFSIYKNAFSIFSDDTNIFDSTVSALGSFAYGVIDLLVAVVFAIYCIFQKENLARLGRKLVYAYLPEAIADGVIRVLRLTNTTFSNFLTGQCVDVCILGSMFAVAMTILGMPYAPVISIVIAVTAFIPVVGAWMGCAVGVFLIYMVNPVQSIWFVVLFALLQWIENNFIYPRVVGTSIGLPGIWVLTAVAIGGDLMGVAGMFLMIPVASVLYTLIRNATHRRLELKNIDPEKLVPQPPDLNQRMSIKSLFGFKKNKNKGKSE